MAYLLFWEEIFFYKKTSQLEFFSNKWPQLVMNDGQKIKRVWLIDQNTIGIMTNFFSDILNRIQCFCFIYIYSITFVKSLFLYNKFIVSSGTSLLMGMGPLIGLLLVPSAPQIMTDAKPFHVDSTPAHHAPESRADGECWHGSCAHMQVLTFVPLF